jgi:hypothetical protein
LWRYTVRGVRTVGCPWRGLRCRMCYQWTRSGEWMPIDCCAECAPGLSNPDIATCDIEPTNLAGSNDSFTCNAGYYKSEPPTYCKRMHLAACGVFLFSANPNRIDRIWYVFWLMACLYMSISVRAGAGHARACHM